MERCCGTCKFWVPGTSFEEILASRRKSMEHCSINNQIKAVDEKACFVWIGANVQELKKREQAGLISLEGDYLF